VERVDVICMQLREHLFKTLTRTPTLGFLPFEHH
jgi:hypothetical protein